MASEWLEQFVNQRVISGTATVITYNRTAEAYDFHVKPHDLRTALWLQLQLAILNDNEFRQCEVCGKWMEISPDTARIHRQFCSNACKVKAYRARKDRAIELRKQVTQLRAIVKELGSDIDTVRWWV